jgi:hypothetical protein
LAAREIDANRLWYDPSLRDFEWRDAPEDDEEAQTILGE